MLIDSYDRMLSSMSTGVGDSVLRELRLRRPAERVDADSGMQWARKMFPGKTAYAFSRSQKRLWSHAAKITADTRYLPLYESILARGAAKTTTVDLIVAWLLATQRRRYVVFACSTLDKAKERVNSVRAILESKEYRRAYPSVSEPALSASGMVRSWSSRLLITESGQAVQAMSLNSDSRGANQGTDDLNIRPDLLVLDDIDKQTDGEAATRRKEEVIAKSLLPMAGPNGLVCIATQNLIIDTGVFAKLMRREAMFGSDRILDGPVPALADFAYESYTESVETEDGNTVPVVHHRITRGTPTWEGQDLATCQKSIDTLGIETFLHEMQHQIDNFEGALLRSEHFQPPPDDFDYSKIKTKIVAVDPSNGRVEHGIICVGSDFATINGRRIQFFHILDDATCKAHDKYTEIAARLAFNHKCDIVVEGNNGGHATKVAIELAIEDLLRRRIVHGRRPKIHVIPATESKKDRAMPAVEAYKQGRVFHPVELVALKREWTTWIPGEKGDNSPNRLDAAVHGINHLINKLKKPAVTTVGITDIFV